MTGTVNKKAVRLDGVLIPMRQKGLHPETFSQRLRFKDDQGHSFPDWGEKRLGEILKYQQPKRYLVTSTKYSNKFQTPVLTAGKTFILGYTDETDGIFSNLPAIIFDDFTTAFKFVDFPFKVKSSAMKMLTMRRIDGDIRFVHAAMLQIRFQAKEHKRYWISQYQKEKIPYPHPDEQYKIASFLDVIDKKIKQLNQKKTLLETYKKGCMQQLFLRQIRFKDNKGCDYPDWEEKRLDDIATIVGGGTPDSNVSDYWDGDIEWFTVTELKRKFLSTSIRKISQRGLNESSANLLPVGSVLLSTGATVGDVGITTKKCSTNQSIHALIMKDLNHNEFWYYATLMCRKEILRRASGSTFSSLRKSELSMIAVKMPYLEEQRKIADFLSVLDVKIDLVAQQLTQTQNFRKGLLQQMFM